MALTGIWRIDPQPQRAVPTVPIPAQGQQPPRIARQAAVAMALIAMAWPREGQPQPIQPAQIKPASQIVPLTLKYGQQPPINAPLSATEMALARAAWPDEFKPTISQPQQTTPSKIVPLTLVYGQRPPLTLVQQAVLASIVAQWPAPTNAEQSESPVAPLTVVVIPAAQPFTVAAFAPIAQWPSVWIAPPAPTDIVPLTLTYGAQPSPAGPLAPAEIAIAGTWPPFWATPQTLVMVAPTIPAIAVQPVLGATVPLSVAGQWPPFWMAPPTLVDVAPLALIYGQQPPAQGPLTSQETALIGAQWPSLWWNANAAGDGAPNAGSIIPAAPTMAPPSATLPIGQWPAPWWNANPDVEIAPVASLVYGQQPSPASPLSALEIAAIGNQWPPAWNPAQSAQPNAAWSGTVLVVSQPYPPSQAGISAWPALWYPPQELVEIAPLTLTYGQQPSAKGGMTAAQMAQAIVGQWPAFWTLAQVASPNAAWNVPPQAPVLSVLERQRSVLLPWQALLQWQIVPVPGMAIDTAAWNVPVVSPHTAPNRFPWDALWARVLREAPWNGSQINQPGGSWIISVPVPVIIAALVGKYKAEHDRALADEGAAVGFAAEWAQALRDLRDAGV